MEPLCTRILQVEVISEIFRVLKPGGQSWIYVYGSDGIWWNVIYKLRKI